MGRSGYDLTDPGRDKSSAAAITLRWHEEKTAKEAHVATLQAAEDAQQKLIRSKRSRGIMVAKKAAKEAEIKSGPADGDH
ncbi:ndufs4 NADH dehydrogenase Fe-S protein subunit [Neodidymelliopsis sp. IMI 364377]|nr:ndufs4 NADH dehydrogenase Fe-S protein subunit [Neodidymelliopsis sp. IMI 364377]